MSAASAGSAAHDDAPVFTRSAAVRYVAAMTATGSIGLADDARLANAIRTK